MPAIIRITIWNQPIVQYSLPIQPLAYIHTKNTAYGQGLCSVLNEDLWDTLFSGLCSYIVRPKH